MGSLTDPQHTLLEAIRVLHRRGAQSVQGFPTFYATGHWRCSILLDGQPTDLRYSEAMGWRLPGRAADTPADSPIDAEGEADLIWAALDARERAVALRADAAYVQWWSDLLDHCGPDVPYLYSDEDDPRREGRMGVSGAPRDPFPLPPAS